MASFSDYKAGELLAKKFFLDFNFFCNFGRQDGFFSVYLEERFIPSEFSLNIPFVVDMSVCLERGKPGRFFILDVQP